MLVEVIYERASTAERAVAFILDLMTVDLLFAALKIAGIKTGWLFLYIAYFSSFEGILGRGLGKWALNLKVTGEDGRAPGLLRAAARSLTLPLSLAFARPIHDRITGTHVVRVEEA